MSTFESLLLHNEKEFQKFSKGPFFEMLTSTNGMDQKKKNKFLNCVQIFSNEFQKLLFSRQASCVDTKFSKTFFKHFEEELGHDELLKKRDNINIVNDAILKASSAWFVLQMFIRDNIEKTVLVHLVLELSGDYYHRIANKVFNDNVSSDYFDVHEELDEYHANMGVDLLENLSDEQYQSLKEISSKGWSMLTVMTNRVHHLVNNNDG